MTRFEVSLNFMRPCLNKTILKTLYCDLLLILDSEIYELEMVQEDIPKKILLKIFTLVAIVVHISERKKLSSEE